MGSRTRQTMKEIDERRARLEATLAELEGRLPPVAQAGKRLLALAAGSSAGTGALILVAKKVFGRSAAKQAAVAVPQVTVKVLPTGVVVGAVAVAAVWGAVRIVEIMARRESGREGRRATVTALPGVGDRRA